METILMVIHLVIVVALILLILLQRSGQDGLSGLGGGATGGSNALFNIRGKANILSRATGFLATAFLCTSLTLAYIATHSGSSVIEKVQAEDGSVSSVVTEGEAEKIGSEEPVKPAEPVVPLAR